MTDSTVKILVYPQFPTAVSAELGLEPTNWEWVQCLAFSIEKLNNLQLSSKPYKWIRYATGIVVGAQGELSTTCESLVPIDYGAGLSAEPAKLYYRTTDQEKRHIFPTDPELAGTRVVISSRASTRRSDFRAEVAERDGSRCVLSNHGYSTCDTAHLLPHNKGDTYIETFTTRRNRGPGSNDIVKDIDDVRNGLFLTGATHRALGKDVAFMMTPNFAMDTTDVDPNADGAERRYSAHLFNLDVPEALGDSSIPSGSAIRVPDDTTKWPPTILFESAYASAVMHHFTAMSADVLKKWEGVFDPGEPLNAAQADQKRAQGKVAAHREITKVQAAERTLRHEQRNERTGTYGTLNNYDLVLIFPYILCQPEHEQVLDCFNKCEEMRAAAECKELEEKVRSWRGEVLDAPMDTWFLSQYTSTLSVLQVFIIGQHQ